jgi:hypothetical protein
MKFMKSYQFEKNFLKIWHFQGNKIVFGTFGHCGQLMPHAKRLKRF